MRLRDKLLLLRAKELSVILPTLQIPRTEFGKALLMNLAVFIERGWGETSGRAQSGSLKVDIPFRRSCGRRRELSKGSRDRLWPFGVRSRKRW